MRVTISRTGYTGEDGFEVFVPPASAERVWDAILAGRQERRACVPAGLGARDTLRLEAAMRLYGNDMDETTTVLEADLGWIVGWKKDDVHRRRRAAAAEGRRACRASWSGFEMLDRAHRPARLRRLRRRREGRRRDERHADAVPEEGDRHGLPAGRPHARRDRVRDRHPRPPRARPQVVPMPFYKRASQTVTRTQSRTAERMYPADLKYTKDHEWVQLAGGDARGRHHRLRAEAARRRRLPRAAGGRPHAEEGRGVRDDRVGQGGLGALSPGRGEVTEVNTALAQNPEAVNKDPHGVVDDRGEGRRPGGRGRAARRRRSTRT